ncbi:MAG: hypothetical protein HOP29_16165 [Phycisphaerales bacterium]|nr:hypothetical protein [Phycisphaerales bacterium]
MGRVRRAAGRNTGAILGAVAVAAVVPGGPWALGQDKAVRFIDSDYQVQVTPPSGWEEGHLVEYNVSGELRAVWKRPNGANITLFIQKPGQALSPDLLTAESARAVAETLKADVREREVRTVAGKRAMWLVFAANGNGAAINPAEKLRTVQHWVAIPRAEDIVVLMLTAADSAYAELGGEFKKMVDSLQVGGEQTPAQRGEYAPVPMNLNFEAVEGDMPVVWSGAGKGYEVRSDEQVVHGGKRAARIQYAGSGEAGEARFGTIVQAVSAERFRGKRIRYTGHLQTKEAKTGWAGLWLRVDTADGKSPVFDNMNDRGVTGTSEWKEYTIEKDVPADAAVIHVGALLLGDGAVWVDDLSLEAVSGVP